MFPACNRVDKARYFHLIGRRDRGIRTVADLKGKRVGVSRKMTAEFYLGRFLELHCMTTDQAIIVPVDYAGSENAIAEGSVDATVSRPLGDNWKAIGGKTGNLAIAGFVGVIDIRKGRHLTGKPGTVFKSSWRMSRRWAVHR